jgi:hypothetical protein
MQSEKTLNVTIVSLRNLTVKALSCMNSLLQYSLLPPPLTTLSVTILTASPLSLLTTLFSSISFLLPRIIFSTSSFACCNNRNCDSSNQTHSSAAADDVFGDFNAVLLGKWVS